MTAVSDVPRKTTRAHYREEISQSVKRIATRGLRFYKARSHSVFQFLGQTGEGEDVCCSLQHFSLSIFALPVNMGIPVATLEAFDAYVEGNRKKKKGW